MQTYSRFSRTSATSRSHHRITGILQQMNCDAVDVSWLVRDKETIIPVVMVHDARGWRLLTTHPLVSYDFDTGVRSHYQLTPIQTAENMLSELTSEVVRSYYRNHCVDFAEGYCRIGLDGEYSYSPDWAEMT